MRKVSNFEEASLDTQNKDGFSALLIAARKQYDDIARMLIHAGADTTLKSLDGNTCMHYYAERGDTPFCKLLVKHGGGVTADAENIEGMTPIDMADLKSHNATREFLEPIAKLNHI